MLNSIFSPAIITELRVLMVDGGIRFVAAIFILVVGWILATWAKRWVTAGLAHLPLDLTLKPLLGSLVRYAILILTLVLVLGQFGVQTTSLIAVLGAAGLAIGLAMQGTLSNVAAGVMLLILRPFRVGQYVQAGGQSGTVREIGLFTTLLTTRDLVYVSVPNSSIFSGVIMNYTRDPIRRVNFTVPIDFVNDIGEAEKTILAALEKNEHVLKAPQAWTGVSELQEYAVVMFVRAYIKSEDYWRALPSIQKSVKDALDTAGILIAVTRQAVADRGAGGQAKPAPAKPESTESEDPAIAAQ
ncbi:MAG TPA: mechanosensitive ion channel domain-containing protein [Rhizomicrobium sp.]|jgi:small conductance mechanosensitive channel